MKRYEAYKNCNIPWIKQIPSHWMTKRAKFLYKKEQRPVREEDSVVTCFRDGVVTLRKNRRTTGFTEAISEFGYQGIRKGDLVIHVMDAFAGAIGVSDSDGKGTPVYNVCTAYGDSNNYYYAYALREMARAGFIQSLYRGIRERSSDFRFDVFERQYLPVPPREEQDQIVRYLDWQVSKINRLIAAKRKEIERIQEHLDKSIEIMFDEIASSSNNSIPLGRHITSIESGTSVNSIMGTADNDSIGVLSTSCVYGNNFDLSQNKRVAPSDYGRVSCPVKKNTLIISRMNAPSLVGAYGFSEKDDTRVYLPDRLWQVRFDNVLMPEYAWRYLSTKRIKSWFATIATGTSSSMKNITKPQLKSIQIPFPSLEKQAETVRRIKTLCDKYNAACHVFEESIMHLIDLRTRLISDVVTGQIDVRSIKVPDNEYINNEITEEEFEEESENNEEE